MSSIPWTTQQKAFFARLQTTDDSLILTAVAGSGKTTTLVEGAKYLRGSILAIAFNVKTKKILEERIGNLAVCKTLNGLGHGALIKFFGQRFEIDRDKTRKITQELLKRDENKHMWLAWTSITQLASRAKAHGLVPKGSPGLFKPLTEDTYESWEDLAVHYDLPFDREIYALAREVLITSISWSFSKYICDFDDQIFLACCWGAPFDKFDNVLVDEAQDLSEIQHALVEKALRKGGRLIAVGDPNQCHPPSTEIYITGVGWRRIEDLFCEGLEYKEVATFNQRKTWAPGRYKQGRKLERIRRSEFSGKLISIGVGTNRVKVTPNHRVLTKLGHQEGVILYAMQRGNQCRLGITSLVHSQGSGLAIRARQEKADKAWLLELFPERRTARIFEAAFAAKFGIPDLIWECSGVVSILQEVLEVAWGLIGNNTDRLPAILEFFIIS